MKIEMNPKIWLEVEGSRGEIFRALMTAKLDKVAKEYMDAASRLFDDDPDSDYMASLPVEDMGEMAKIIRALPPRSCYLGLRIEAAGQSGKLGVWAEGMAGRTATMKGAWAIFEDSALKDTVRNAAKIARDTLAKVL